MAHPEATDEQLKQVLEHFQAGEDIADLTATHEVDEDTMYHWLGQALVRRREWYRHNGKEVQRAALRRQLAECQAMQKKCRDRALLEDMAGKTNNAAYHEDKLLVWQKQETIVLKQLSDLEGYDAPKQTQQVPVTLEDLEEVTKIPLDVLEKAVADALNQRQEKVVHAVADD